MREKWKNIPGYRRDLQVSDLGRLSFVKIINGTHKRFVYKNQVAKNGTTIGVPINNPREGVKRTFIGIVTLVVKAFIDESLDSRDVRYKDGDRSNIALSNYSVSTKDVLMSYRFKSDMKYIQKTRNDTWCVTCVRGRKRYHFGTFKTVEEAKECRSVEVPKLDRRLRSEAIQRITK